MSGFRETIDPNWRKFLPRDPRTFIGMRNQNALDESLPVVDRILDPQTMARFMEFAISGKSPLGGDTKLPLLPPELIHEYLMAPYARWAPGPHDKFGTSPFGHALIRIGSHQDDSRLMLIEKGVHAMKSRLWEGIAPMTENRWRQKKLDDPDYHFMACRYLGMVIEVFAYLQEPGVLNNLTETYRLIHAHFSDFDRIVNALPQRSDKSPIGLAALWEEFLTAHYTVMTTRAHSWVLSKITSLRARDDTLLAALHPAPNEEYSPEQMRILNRVQDLAELVLRADYTIFIHMPKSDPPVQKMVSSLEIRRQNAAREVKMRSRQKTFQNVMMDMGNVLPLNSPASMLRSIKEQRDAQDEVRAELRGEPISLPRANWIVKLQEKLKDAEEKKWGFVAYRLTYTQSKEEWVDFVKKLEADLNDWGEGEDGAENVKKHAKLEWRDGKELGIAEGDIEGAKKHYATSKDENSRGWEADVFLAIDAFSYASYTHGLPFSSGLLAGDTGGFVTAVDVEFDPNDRGDHAEESPYFSGQLRVLGNLVYPEVYAMLAAQIHGTEELWPLAMNHPDLVYTGPTLTLQVEQWKKATKTKIKMLEIFTEQVKTQNAGAST